MILINPQGYLASHQLDRANFGLDFDCFWNCVGKALRAEFVEEAVIAPLVILCGDIADDANLSNDEVPSLGLDIVNLVFVLPLKVHFHLIDFIISIGVGLVQVLIVGVMMFL